MSRPVVRRRAVAAAAAVATGVAFLAVAAVPAPAVPGPGEPPSKFTYLRSTDGGATYGPMGMNDASVEAEQTQVEATASTVHALYDDKDPQPRRIFYRRSTDGGATFTPAVRIDRPLLKDTVEVGDSGEANLIANSGTLQVFWEDDLVLGEPFQVPAPGALVRKDLHLGDGRFVDSEDGGPADKPDDPDDTNNFVLPAGYELPAGSLDPRTSGQLVFDDPAVEGTQYTVEPDNRDDVYYARSDDDGAAFTRPVNLSASPQVHNRDPDVALEGASLVVAYEGGDVDPAEPVLSAGDDIFYSYSQDGGESWEGTNLNLTNAPGDQDEPATALSGGQVTVLFRDRDSGRVAFVHADRLAGPFSALKQLPGKSAAASESSTPSAYAAGDVVDVVACQNTDPDPDLDGDETFKLFRWRSTNGGAKFAKPEVLDKADGECNKPAIDGAGPDVHVVYQRDIDGVSDVWTVGSTDQGKTFGRPRNLSQDGAESDDPDVSLDPAHPERVYVSWSNDTDVLFSTSEGQSFTAADGTARPYDNEDVIRATGLVYEMVFDGSDVGLAPATIDGLARPSPNELLFSFAGPVAVDGLGTVDGADIVKFTATSLGEDTAGTFSLWFDGSDVGLEGPEEDIDALELRAGELYLSTAGAFDVPGLQGGGGDIVVCAPTSLGDTTACGPFTMPFKGSVAGVTGAGNNVDAFAFDNVDVTPYLNSDGDEVQVDESRSLFSFAGDWKARTESGGAADIVACTYPKAEEAVPGPAPQPTGLADCGVKGGVPFRSLVPGAAHGLLTNVSALELDY